MDADEKQRLKDSAAPRYVELTKAIEAQTEAQAAVLAKLEDIRIQNEDSAKLDCVWRDRWLEECSKRKSARNWGIVRALAIPVAGISVAMMDSDNPIKTSLLVIFKYIKDMA